MKRRRFIKTMGAMACYSILNRNCDSQTKKPNIIFILADDLGYAELGCYGQEKIETPHIDQLARMGKRFTQHYSGSPVCAPSRCVLLTGKHSGHAFIRGNHEWGERGDVWNYEKAVEDSYLEGQYPIPDNTQTIAKLLQNVGYKTALVGKWGLGGPQTGGIPNKQGFDFFYGYNCQRQAHTYYPRHLWRNREKEWLDNVLYVPGTKLPTGADPNDEKSYAHFSQPLYSPDLMFKEIVRFLEEKQNDPFFLYWATPIPHVPIQAPQRWIDYYVKKFGDEEPYLGDKGYCPCRYPHATYAAMVSYLDEQVGLLIKQLKELGIYHNTLIMFSSDNGAGIGGGSTSPWFDGAKPFITEQGRTKGSVFEGGLRVPLIVVWPGKIKAGSETNLISAFYDVLPTLCEIAGITSPQDIDGISFLPTLLDQKQREHDFLYWEFPGYGGQQALRKGDWKAMRRNILDGNTALELFNLSDDIQEKNNLALQHPDIVEEMKAIMESQHTPSGIDRFKMKALGDK